MGAPVMPQLASAGARGAGMAAAERDVGAALEGLARTDKIAVLVGVLAAEAARSGQPRLFFALLQQAVRDRVRDRVGEAG